MQKLMRRLAVAAVLSAAAGTGSLTNLAIAEQTANPRTVQEFTYQVVGTSVKEPQRVRPWSVEFDTAAEAHARAAQIIRDHSKGGLLESETDAPRNLSVAKIPKNAPPVKNVAKEVDDALDAAKKKLTDAEHKVGDTLKEYTRRIEAAYENASKAKQGLTSMTGRISREQFDAVNQRIDSFNGLRTETRDRVGVAGESLLGRFPTMSRVSPQDLKLEDSPSSKFASIAGKRGSGTFGGAKIDVEFQEGGKVVFSDPDTDNRVLSEGTWSQTGDQVVMTTKRFSYAGNVIQSGVEGSRTEGHGIEESWSLTFGPKQQSSISGTYWKRQGSLGIGIFSGLYFNKDNTVVISVYPDGRRTGKWFARGDNVTIIESDGDVRQVTISGSRLTTDFGRGPAYFTRN